MIHRTTILTLAAAAALTLLPAPPAHADNDQLGTATREVCGLGGRSGNPFQLFGEKMSLEQRFGLTDGQATSLMWQAINTGCP
jgi:hypothetical protein